MPERPELGGAPVASTPPAADALAALPLARVREAALAPNDAPTRGAWVVALRRDERAGARKLADRLERELEAERAEAARLDALFERRAALLARGVRYVAGVDEVGVGPLAGPVVAAAVVLPERVELPGLDDSKKLQRPVRERLDEQIRGQALGIGIGEVSAREIDELNILRASLEAMRRAVVSLCETVDVGHLMVDARIVPGVTIAQTPLTHGDAIDGSIAAASIVAKVHRDALMRSLGARHPGYGFERHSGYGTAEHVAALGRLGASPQHRRSFAPVAAVVG